MALPIRVTGALFCAPDEVETVRTALPDHIRLSRAETGCLSFDVRQSSADPCRWDLYESFADRAAFEAHQARTRASDWWRVTAHMRRDFKIQE